MSKKLTHEEYVERLKLINPNIDVIEPYNGNKKSILHCCTIHHEEYLATPSSLLNGCNFCQGCKNDSGKVHNHESYINKLQELNSKIQPIETYINSITKIHHKCSECGKEIYDTPNAILAKLKRHQTVCSGCSDGISYANKFSYRFFNQFRNHFKTYIREYSPDWCVYYDFDGNIHHGKYDNMIIFNNGFKLIVEMDGNYHYEYNKFNKQDAELSQFFDMQKDYCAIDNGFIVIRIDCNYNNREDRFKYIKNSIESNNLINQLFDLSDVNWDEISIKAEKSSFIEACELWNCGMKIIDISEKLALCTGTIRTYLKNGTELGLCYYDPKENKDNVLRVVSANRCKSCICITTGLVFQSIKQAELFYKIDSSAIVSCCKGKKKYAGKYNGQLLEWAYV